MIPKVELPKEKQKEAERYGGYEPPAPYIRRDSVPSADKGGHAERSKANDERHRKR